MPRRAVRDLGVDRQPLSPQWLIIQGRLLGKALVPLAAVTVALRCAPVEQQPQPAGWRMRA